MKLLATIALGLLAVCHAQESTTSAPLTAADCFAKYVERETCLEDALKEALAATVEFDDVPAAVQQCYIDNDCIIEGPSPGSSEEGEGEEGASTPAPAKYEDPLTVAQACFTEETGSDQFAAFETCVSDAGYPPVEGFDFIYPFMPFGIGGPAPKKKGAPLPPLFGFGEKPGLGNTNKIGKPVGRGPPIGPHDLLLRGMKGLVSKTEEKCPDTAEAVFQCITDGTGIDVKNLDPAAIKEALCEAKPACDELYDEPACIPLEFEDYKGRLEAGCQCAKKLDPKTIDDALAVCAKASWANPHPTTFAKGWGKKRPRFNVKKMNCKKGPGSLIGKKPWKPMKDFCATQRLPF